MASDRCVNGDTEDGQSQPEHRPEMERRHGQNRRDTSSAAHGAQAAAAQLSIRASDATGILGQMGVRMQPRSRRNGAPTAHDVAGPRAANRSAALRERCTRKRLNAPEHRRPSTSNSIAKGWATSSPPRRHVARRGRKPVRPAWSTSSSCFRRPQFDAEAFFPIRGPASPAAVTT